MTEERRRPGLRPVRTGEERMVSVASDKGRRYHSHFTPSLSSLVSLRSYLGSLSPYALSTLPSTA